MNRLFALALLAAYALTSCTTTAEKPQVAEVTYFNEYVAPDKASQDAAWAEDSAYCQQFKDTFWDCMKEQKWLPVTE